jgi:hypothetical protein
MVSRPESGVKFQAAREELRLVMRPERKRFDAEGNPIETIEGRHLAFMSHYLTVPAAEKMRGEKGEDLETAEVLAFLKRHPLYGDREEGFWEHKEAAPAPSAQELEKLTDLAVSGDVEGLRQLVQEERTGWGRKALLEPAEKALETLSAREAPKQERKGAAARTQE